MAETENTLTKVDSLVEEQPAKKTGHRRASSLAADVYNLVDLGKFHSNAIARGRCGDVGLT